MHHADHSWHPHYLAMRDMLLGESITGLFRFVESLLIAASIAGGFLLATVLAEGVLWMGQILAGALGASASPLSRVRKSTWRSSPSTPGLSWAVYLAVNALAGDFAGNMASAMFCSLMAAVLARRIKVPTVVLQMPATVP